MITVEAAQLLATVYPIAILILTVEARALPKTEGRWLWVRRMNVVGRAIQALIVLAGLSATVTCVSAVVADSPLEGGVATFVLASGAGLYVVSILVIMGLTFDRLGFTDWISDREDARLAARAARRSA